MCNIPTEASLCCVAGECKDWDGNGLISGNTQCTSVNGDYTAICPGPNPAGTCGCSAANCPSGPTPTPYGGDRMSGWFYVTGVTPTPTPTTGGPTNTPSPTPDPCACPAQYVQITDQTAANNITWAYTTPYGWYSGSPDGINIANLTYSVPPPGGNCNPFPGVIDPAYSIPGGCGNILPAVVCVPECAATLEKRHDFNCDGSAAPAGAIGSQVTNPYYNAGACSGPTPTPTPTGCPFAGMNWVNGCGDDMSSTGCCIAEYKIQAFTSGSAPYTGMPDVCPVGVALFDQELDRARKNGDVRLVAEISRLIENLCPGAAKRISQAGDAALDFLIPDAHAAPTKRRCIPDCAVKAVNLGMSSGDLTLNTGTGICNCTSGTWNGTNCGGPTNTPTPTPTAGGPTATPTNTPVNTPTPGPTNTPTPTPIGCPSGSWVVGNVACYCRSGCMSASTAVPPPEQGVSSVSGTGLDPINYPLLNATTAVNNLNRWGHNDAAPWSNHAGSPAMPTYLKCVYESAPLPVVPPVGAKVGCTYKEAYNYDITANIEAGFKDPRHCIFQRELVTPKRCKGSYCGSR